MRWKDDPEWQKYIRDRVKLNEKGELEGKNSGFKVQVTFNRSIKGKNTAKGTSLSHLIWFLAEGVWPAENMHVDHIDDDPFHNKTDNYELVTPQQNYNKTRGRRKRNFGKTEYGHGLSYRWLKNRKAFVLNRYCGSFYVEGKRILNNRYIGYFRTKEEMDSFVKDYIKDNINIDALDEVNKCLNAA